jgi:CBS domain containing-hemolysin-like protein
MAQFLQSLPLWSHWLAVMAVLVTASAFFSASETALFFLSHGELRRLRFGTVRERLAARLLQDPERLLSAILFCNLVVNMLYFAVTVIVSHRLTREHMPVAAGVFGLVSVFLLILFGEVMPKSFAVAFGKPLVRVVSLPLTLIVRLLDPLLPKLARLTTVLRRTFWPRLQREPYLQAEDLERLVEVAGQSAEVVEQERQVLHNILDLSEIPVEEVMRPRGAYLTMTPPIDVADLKGEVPPGGFIALVAEGSDDLLGAVRVTDFTLFPRQNIELTAEDAPPVPWCASCAYTLALMRQKWTGTASVVNEYGETMGVVLEEDILDTMLASQPSRARRLLQRDPIEQAGPGTLRVDGLTTIRHLCLRLGLEYEPSPEGLITVAGLVYELLGHIPEPGDESTWRGYRFQVTEVDKRGRLRTLVTAE